MFLAGFSALVHEQVTELRGRHPLGISFCIPSGSPLVTTYVHDQLSEVLLFSIVRTFYSRQVQAPAVNYIRKTFRVRLKTSCIPGCVPIWIEPDNGAKRRLMYYLLWSCGWFSFDFRFLFGQLP